LKNVLAIGAGVVDGLQLGLNARTALITRGMSDLYEDFSPKEAIYRLMTRDLKQELDEA
jgi:hypothetical protein